jgi:phosphatidylcholine synthase
MLRLSAAGVRGYLVHAYTASTLLFVALAMQWILEARFELSLLAMAATVLIDATDGALARKYRVAETASGIQGDLLDNLVDFVSYVALPALFLLRAEMLLPPVAVWLTVLMTASVFGFARTTAKIADKGFFVGFPSYWNIVVFYLFLLETTPLVNTLVLVALSSAVLVPVRFLYLTRLPRWRSFHLTLSGVWGAACLVALLIDPGWPRIALLYASLAYVAFYVAQSLLADAVDRRNET